MFLDFLWTLIRGQKDSQLICSVTSIPLDFGAAWQLDTSVYLQPNSGHSGHSGHVLCEAAQTSAVRRYLVIGTDIHAVNLLEIVQVYFVISWREIHKKADDNEWRVEWYWMTMIPCLYSIRSPRRASQNSVNFLVLVLIKLMDVLSTICHAKAIWIRAWEL